MCVFAKLADSRGMPGTALAGAPAFVSPGSIVRRIWGNGDVVLFLFAGAAAEFSLNKEVDWLFFTGRLPADPIGRMFSTVAYARSIIFSTAADAHAAIDKINAIHGAVEQKRGRPIPEWAYRDVLYMLIAYSISAYELLERKLRPEEREDVYDVFYRMGSRMGIANMPGSYAEWLPDRVVHMQRDLVMSKHTVQLFDAYRAHLGIVRYSIMRQVQGMLLPAPLREVLALSTKPLFSVVLMVYKFLTKVRLGGICRNMLLPAAYREAALRLDVVC